MTDYRKLYALLCCAIDEVLDPLNEIPAARPYARALQAALLQAEALYTRKIAPPSQCEAPTGRGNPRPILRRTDSHAGVPTCSE